MASPGAQRVGGVVIDIRGDSDPFMREMKKAEGQARTTGGAMQASMAKADEGVKGVTGSVAALTRSLAPLLASVAILNLGKDAIQAADKFSLMRSRLRLVVTESENLYEVEDRLAQQAMANRADLQATVGLYTRLRQVRKDLSDEAARQIVDQWSKTLIVSGASASEAASATMQFAQAMASGRLAGDELRSILENNSRFALLLSDGLGVSVGELRNLGEQGRLTTDVIIAAMDKAGVSAEEFGKKAMTFGQAMTNVGTALVRLVGITDQALGLSGEIARWTNLLALAVEGLAKFIGEANRQSISQKEVLHDAEDALKKYQQAIVLSATATGKDTEAKRENLGVVRESTRETLKKAEALLAEAEAELVRAQAQQRASGGRDTDAYRIQTTTKLIDALRARADAIRNTLAIETEASVKLAQGFAWARAELERLGVKITPPGKTEAPVIDGVEGVTVPVTIDVIDWSRAEERTIDDILSDIRTSAEQYDGPTLANMLGLDGDIEGLTSDIPEAVEYLGQQFEGMGSTIRDAVASGLMQGVETGDWGDAMRDILYRSASDGLSRAIDVLLDALEQVDWGAIFNSGSSGQTGWAGFFTAIGSAFGGGKASGGAVTAGKAYTVGELGPERFVPMQNGVILPNTERTTFATGSDGKGRSSIHIGGPNVVINGNVDSVTMPQLAAALEAYTRRLPSIIDNRVIDQQGRGAYG